MVAHTFIYTGAVRKIRELVGAGTLGQLRYCDSVRVNLGLFQHNVNVLWDLAVHDLSIIDHLIGEYPEAVSATGASHIAGEPENIAYLTLFYPRSLTAHIHVNWLAPVKLRRTVVAGSDKMVVYDDLEPSEKVKVYDSGISVQQNGDSVQSLLVSYRTGDMWAPRLDATEALRVAGLHFLDCIRHARQPLTDGRAGLRAIRTLEAAGASMVRRGAAVPVRND